MQQNDGNVLSSIIYIYNLLINPPCNASQLYSITMLWSACISFQRISLLFFHLNINLTWHLLQPVYIILFIALKYRRWFFTGSKSFAIETYDVLGSAGQGCTRVACITRQGHEHEHRTEMLIRARESISSPKPTRKSLSTQKLKWASYTSRHLVRSDS